MGAWDRSCPATCSPEPADPSPAVQHLLGYCFTAISVLQSQSLQCLLLRENKFPVICEALLSISWEGWTPSVCVFPTRNWIVWEAKTQEYYFGALSTTTGHTLSQITSSISLCEDIPNFKPWTVFGFNTRNERQKLQGGSTVSSPAQAFVAPLQSKPHILRPQGPSVNMLLSDFLQKIQGKAGSSKRW